ncbi:16S rRNA (guanine(527)-N(7))-methyltransferase RsmG [bacterium]|nr:16S rRNA (guanine(527)-N(7))-methyltransferase RsmG [bacterium]
MKIEDMLEKGVKSFGIDIGKNKITKFKEYMQLIKKWNEVTNITAIKKEEDIIIKHFIDSISSSMLIGYKSQSIIDIGTGVGFPGLPLKIIFPELKIVFVDSSKKRTRILENICKNLKISKYLILNDNIENIGHLTEHRQKYDIVISRAVASMSTLIEYGIPLLKQKGRLILYKGLNVENAENALIMLRAKITENVDFILPLSNNSRKIIVVEKMGITPEQLPRKVGIPRKRPL